MGKRNLSSARNNARKKRLNQKKKLEFKRLGAFTIVEVLIVLAIAGLVMVVVFLAVPALYRQYRNYQRRAFVQEIYSGMFEFKNYHSKIVGCDTAGSISCTGSGDNAIQLLKSVLNGREDPFTGAPFDLTTLSDNGNTVATSSNSVLYVYDSSHVDHSKKPLENQILIEIGHWCYSTKPDTGPSTNPIASLSLSTFDNQVDKFVVLIGLESGNYFCIDNYY